MAAVLIKIKGWSKRWARDNGHRRIIGRARERERERERGMDVERVEKERQSNGQQTVALSKDNSR